MAGEKSVERRESEIISDQVCDWHRELNYQNNTPEGLGLDFIEKNQKEFSEALGIPRKYFGGSDLERRTLSGSGVVIRNIKDILKLGKELA